MLKELAMIPISKLEEPGSVKETGLVAVGSESSSGLWEMYHSNNVVNLDNCNYQLPYSESQMFQIRPANAVQNSKIPVCTYKINPLHQ